ncbi:MAG: DUF3341 domain-containing protein [Candidatus Dadabacteria bacterium]|nr:MAG: DUF3341 domain-containing protein [Candidatus Dadabacteria bacterium]
MNKVVVGVFKYADDTAKAVKLAKERGLKFWAYTPCPTEEVEEAVAEGRSNVRGVSLTGALLGLAFGFTLAIWCSLDYPLRVSAKDIVSVPAFVVIGYECTILFGALATLLGIFYFCRIPNPLRKIGYHPRFSDDRFGVAVSCPEDEIAKVEEGFKKIGAEEVIVKDGI